MTKKGAWVLAAILTGFALVLVGGIAGGFVRRGGTSPAAPAGAAPITPLAPAAEGAATPEAPVQAPPTERGYDDDEEEEGEEHGEDHQRKQGHEGDDD